ncbi:hypothetical protein H5410_050221 [Solanum commersonii]|uniref:DUF1985 domain-containing protein n=1 Tax=Solanum commersonii TaxID=4109 RepID=A0A9J5WUY2_SOLCO|nr:hypothetical protein H5410_050221 [Solanum commersonii]
MHEIWLCMNDKSACFGLREFALIMGLNCSAYPRDAKMTKILQKGDKFYYKVTKNKNITSTKLMSLIKGTRLNKKQKLKCSLVWFVHSMLLAHDRSKIAFSHLGKYAKKSFDSPLLIPRLLRWHTTKSDNIVKSDPFKYKGRSTKIVHPYLTPTVRETKQNYMATLMPYTDEVKDTIINTLKVNLKGVIVLTSTVKNEEDEILGENNSNKPKLRRAQKNKKNKATDLAAVDEDYTALTVDENGVAVDVDEILPLAIVDKDLVAVDEYFAEKVDEQEEEIEEK